MAEPFKSAALAQISYDRLTNMPARPPAVTPARRYARPLLRRPPSAVIARRLRWITRLVALADTLADTPAHSRQAGALRSADIQAPGCLWYTCIASKPGCNAPADWHSKPATAPRQVLLRQVRRSRRRSPLHARRQSPHPTRHPAECRPKPSQPAGCLPDVLRPALRCRRTACTTPDHPETRQTACRARALPRP